MGGVGDEELLSIGRFAEISGLSIHALRHYDDVGLLAPAETDPRTGYRRYRRDQVPRARVIQGLRWVNLPIEELRLALDDLGGPTTRRILLDHRDRLCREQGELAARLTDLDNYLAKGITMAPTTTARPVQLKITVDDAAVAFYQKAFGFHYDVTRRTDSAEYSGFVFGKYGDDEFFLLHLLAADESDRLGPTTFGLLVDDLEAAHTRAIEAGAVEVVPPRDAQGMPRTSAVRDPSGNWIWLYQS
jgi:DNA-binding transcriptional MerR regulator